MKLLLIEDEHRIAQAIKEGLEQETFAIDVEFDGENGLLAADTIEYDLIILDIMLPKMNGIEVCKALRAKGHNVPILMLTARDQDVDVITGLNNGADDYLAKPFAFEVLLARIRALLRRPKNTIDSELKIGELTLNTLTKSVKRGETSIKLSAKEYAVLEYMMRNPDKILSKNNIISHVWDFDADILPNNVEVFINYLRSKIDKPFKGPRLIHTVRGFGYKIGIES